ncbi:hypothetical protein ABMX69_06825 [Vibrio vulnificus]|uniref:hypothetical protein n=1 Tax=Vibrio vulnificus TaxID=672 RepID=UPI000A5367DA|nr:hypothetical protein [Vibrio vulnificus]EHT4939545.1 hypothetical protein [Vibrio vulnificus]
MEKQNQITQELEQQINVVGKNPFAKGFVAPLRLLMVWIKNTNARLDAMEKQINP